MVKTAYDWYKMLSGSCLCHHIAVIASDSADSDEHVMQSFDMAF